MSHWWAFSLRSCFCCSREKSVRFHVHVDDGDHTGGHESQREGDSQTFSPGPPTRNTTRSMLTIDMSVRRLPSVVGLEHFPMKCVRMKTLLAMESMTSFGKLEERNSLIEPTVERVHFISHQWLGDEHPDPQGVQLRRMQEIFSEIIAKNGKSLFTPSDWETFSTGKSVTSRASETLGKHEEALQDYEITEKSMALHLKHGLVWMDFSSIPQLSDIKKEDGFEQQTCDQQAAVRSIPCYLERADYFWIVAPLATHVNKNITCGFGTYRKRCWCRLEEWGNLLSKKALMPLVITERSRLQTYSATAFVADNVNRPERAPCNGECTCCTKQHTITTVNGAVQTIPCDKTGISDVLEDMICAKIAYLKHHGNPTWVFFIGLQDVIRQTSVSEASTALAEESLQDFATGFGCSSLCETGPFGMTPLHFAAASGNASKIRQLLSEGSVNPLKHDCFGHTPFHYFALSGSVEGAKEFQKSGCVSEALVNHRGELGEASLHKAAEFGREEIIRLLISLKALVNLPKSKASPQAGRTALHEAAAHGQVGSCEVLMDARADVTATDAEGATPLDLAVLEMQYICLIGNQESGSRAVVASLLKRRANVPGLLGSS